MMKLSHVRTSVPCDRCLAPPWGSGLVPFLSTAKVMKVIAVAPAGALLAFKAKLANAGTYLAAILQVVVDAVADAISSEKKLQRSERAARERLAAREHQRWEALLDEIVDEEALDLDEVPAGALDWAMAS